MKKLLPICIALVLSACGGASQPPTSPSGSTGGTPGGAPGYPYNPGRNPTEDTDPRIPYYGEWAWAVTFPGGTVAKGRMSISRRITPGAGYANASEGMAVWCPDGDVCPYEGDTALIGTTSNNGQGELIVEMDDPAQDNLIRFVGVDLDGVVDTDSSGRPTLTGNGTWNLDSGSVYVAFTLTQTSTKPMVKASTMNAAPSLLSTLDLTTAILRPLFVSDLQRRAVAAVRGAWHP